MKYVVCMILGLSAGIAIQALPLVYSSAIVGFIIGTAFVIGGVMK